ncbi:MAG: DUF2848 domain-containing protein [Steroidobacteraceae bacterium]
MTFELVQQSGNRRAQVPVDTVVIAGWTGRDAAAVEEHITELEKLGVKRPTSIPMFYPVASARLTTHDHIEALGNESSGEVEFVLLQHEGRLWVSVGSDHTDRRVETYNICVSKQMCDKPVASTWWAQDEVQAHWDRLRLRSYIGLGAERALYQDGSVAAMLEPATLLARYRQAGGTFGDGMLMFCGTLPAQGGIRPAPHFSFELEDPVAGRIIRHGYGISCLPLPS